MNKAIKPPLGILPKKFYNEVRFYDLKLTIQRYLDVNKQIPFEWLEEYNELLKQF